MRQEQLQVGAPASLSNVRACRMLRFVALQARNKALLQEGSRDHGVARAGRKLGLVLYRRAVRAGPQTDRQYQRDQSGRSGLAQNELRIPPMPGTDAVVPEIEQFILTSLPPGAAQKRLALVVLLGILVVVFIVTGPLSHLRTSPVPAFIPIYVTTMITTDSITAVLLFTQFAILRSRAILVIAIGYAFAALVLIPYLLTFPGVFGPR